MIAVVAVASDLHPAAAPIVMHSAALAAATRFSCKRQLTRLLQQTAARGISRVSAHSSISSMQNPSAPPVPDLSQIKGVLFDIDGTLTNSDPLHLLA